MSLTGNGSLSLKRKDVKEQKSLAVGFKKLTFAHKASLGETGINLGALVLPSEMSSFGFSNPTSGELSAAQLLFYKQNLTLVSSSRGLLMQDLSYSVQTSSRIVFNGFTSLENEIFVGVIDYNARNGINVVDAAPLISTGTLAVGVADFNVGTPFEIGKYADISQVGQVVVYRNGVQQFRNTGNSSTVLDGNYYEVDAGNGLGVIIRFNNAAAIQSDSILVFSHGLLAYKPDGSVLAQIENLAGQLDQIVPTVAALAGQPETNYRAAPNNVDLKAFGDRVLQAEADIDYLFTNSADFQRTNSPYKTPVATGHWHAHTSNALTVSDGVYELTGAADFSSAGPPGYTNLNLRWMAANGADSASTPAQISTLANVTVLGHIEAGSNLTATISLWTAPAQTLIISVTGSATIYLDTYADASTPANARISVRLASRKLK